MAEDAGGLLGALFARAVDLGREEPRPALTLTHHRKGLDWGRGRRGVALGEVGYGNYLYCWYSLHAACVAGHATSGNLRPTVGGDFLFASGANRFESLWHPLRHCSPLGVSAELGNDPFPLTSVPAPHSANEKLRALTHKLVCRYALAGSDNGRAGSVRCSGFRQAPSLHQLMGAGFHLGGRVCWVRPWPSFFGALGDRIRGVGIETGALAVAS